VDELKLSPAHTTLVVPTRTIADAMRQEHASDNQAMAIAVPDLAFAFTDPLPWHFVALEDLDFDFSISNIKKIST
jgi:hypothetical protein